MLLNNDVLARIKAGEIDTVFRRWKRATVKAGGTLMTGAGVLAIDAVETIEPEQLTPAHVKRAGFTSVEAFRGWLDEIREGQLYMIRLHYAGEDPRIALRNEWQLSARELAEVWAALDKLDSKAPWTRTVLTLIEKHPGRLAVRLARELGMERDPFKTKVRKLKALGLTESLEVGYRLSPRGAAVLSAMVKNK